MMTIAFTGGGSGGHIFPGLAVAERLRQRLNCRIVWLGSRSELDRKIVEKAGLDFVALPAGKWRRYFSLKNFTDLFLIIAGFVVARRYLKRIRPSLVFSKGGFVSVPPCLAARSLNIPLYIHESDYSPGLATKLTAPAAKLIYVAYTETASQLAVKLRSKVVVIGNPLRAAFETANEDRGRRFLGLAPARRILLVLGGSQGARQVNELITAARPALEKLYYIVHQTGDGLGEVLATANYRPFTFIHDELPDLIAAAELVVGRSGAGSLWEAAALGKPMVLIPLASAARGDQVENAAYFSRLGAAVSLIGTEAVPERLVAAVKRIHNDKSYRLTMAAAAAAAATKTAADDIVSIFIRDLLERET